MDFKIESANTSDVVVALAGNPNVGKSTVFNSLTGLNQHTGNWPGKTVARADGAYTYENSQYTVIDLPGTYSLMSSSKEEEITCMFLCSSQAETVVAIADATCLERNLNLVLQILEITKNCILCVNLMDEAKKKNISIDLKELQDILKIPVIGISAARKNGTLPLCEEISKLSKNHNNDSYIVRYDTVIENSIENLSQIISEELPHIDFLSRFIAIKLICNDEKIIRSIEESHQCCVLDNENIANALETERKSLVKYGISDSNINDKIVCSIVSGAEQIASKCVRYHENQYDTNLRKIDKIVTSKLFGIPIMIALLAVIFYLSVVGANYPSQILSDIFTKAELLLNSAFTKFNVPDFITSILISGVFRTLAWVVSVMLPPMAIFFPLFTLLENLGYLPRIAFNLDGVFKKCRAHGKQCLTMCMGLGCNAVGVTGTRIIDSPRERLIAIITNSFMPCNGRFPTLITVSTIFFGATLSVGAKSLISALTVSAVVIIGVMCTFAVSYVLSSTFLKGTPSQFTLELPPYRKPKIWEIIYRSVFDRTLFVLGRAAAVAAPAGAIIWLFANVYIGDFSILTHTAMFLEPFAKLLGLDGYILVAFILGIPANEIVLPIILMCYSASGTLSEMGTITETGQLLMENGWNIITAINVMLFSLLHFPCATTLITIHKETKSFKWTFLSFIIPTVIGITVCFIIAQVSKLFI